MSCCNSGPSKNSIEFQRRFKPQNNKGCACSSPNGNCKTPSLAMEGSPLWEWEKIYGKLVETVTLVQNEDGHTVQIVEKIPCPVEIKQKSRHGCCSLRYKVVR